MEGFNPGYGWASFLWTADEWLITYSLPPLDLINVKLFLIGHVVELYLKAANTKITGKVERAVRFGHRLKELWDDCKARSPGFMPSYQLLDSIHKADVFSGKPLEDVLDKEDRREFLQNQEFYAIARLLPDLKYLGAPLKNWKGALVIGAGVPNTYWIYFLRELRAFLGYPRQDQFDMIAVCLKRGDLPSVSANFLARLYGPSDGWTSGAV